MPKKKKVKKEKTEKEQKNGQIPEPEEKPEEKTAKKTEVSEEVESVEEVIQEKPSLEDELKNLQDRHLSSVLSSTTIRSEKIKNSHVCCSMRVRM